MASPYAGNPATRLNRHLHEGGLVLVAGRSGVGKTALLCHAALDALLQGQRVLHLSLTESVDHVRAHYDEVLRVVAASDQARLQVERGRVIHSTRDHGFDRALLKRHLDMLGDAADFHPDMVVIDGIEGGTVLSEHVGGLREIAAGSALRCWVNVQSDEPVPGEVFPHAQFVVRLVHDGNLLRLQAVHGDRDHAALPMVLDPATLRVSEGASDDATQPVDGPSTEGAAACTLYSGGAAGSEAAFGEAAARYGVHEVAFTFEGHLQTRHVGKQELSPRELAMGDVSLTYVSRQLNRSYNDTGGLIRGVLQTLWHMVSRSQQVFVVGTIQGDGTVRGGTGWSVELARMWSRELWVFDQPRNTWHRWHADEGWTPGSPRIHTTAVCGTGTRQITEEGKRAIDTLFAESFGAIQ